MAYKGRHVIFGVMCLVLGLVVAVEGAQGNRDLSDALYYRDLTEFTCRLQIDYYQALDAYLEKTGAARKPLLIPYYIGLAYFELGNFSKAGQFFKRSVTVLSSASAPPRSYKYYSLVMEAACSYMQGEERPVEALAKPEAVRKNSPGERGFLGYIFLRLNYRADRAGRLLAESPEDLFGEVISQWAAYKLDLLPVGEIKIPQYKFKIPEYEEIYGQVRLSREAIDISLKYYNPSALRLLEEIYLEKAKLSFLDSNTEDLLPLALINFLQGEYETAIKHLKIYQRKFPLDVQANLLTGECFYYSGDRPKAENIWAWTKQSGDRHALRELALVLSNMRGKQLEALRLIKRAKDKNLSKTQRFDSGYYQRHKHYYRSLGRVYLNLKKYKQAGDTFMLTYERSRSGKPQTYDRTYLLSLGFTLAKVGRFKEAIDNALKGASSLNPAAYPLFHAVNFGLYMLNSE